MVMSRGMMVFSRVEPSFQDTDNLVKCIIRSLFGLQEFKVLLFRSTIVKKREQSESIKVRSEKFGFNKH